MISVITYIYKLAIENLELL